MKTKLNEYKYVIEGFSNNGNDFTYNYLNEGKNNIISITDDIAEDIQSYKTLNTEMIEIDETPISTKGIEFSYNGSQDGSYSLVGADFDDTTYDPEKHIIKLDGNAYTANFYDHAYIKDDVLYLTGISGNQTITLNLYKKKRDRNYLYTGTDHPIQDDRYNVSKALSDDTELLLQQNKQIGVLGLITTGILGVGLYVLSRK